MFTGIVQSLCTLLEVSDESNLRRLKIDLGPLTEALETGASVAVNGTCLTVTAVDAASGVASFDVIRETLGLTNLGGLQVGDRVNVERSYRVGDEIGGHIVSGHVSGVATVARIESAENERTLFFRVPRELTRYLSMKGFVALDGASLTLASVTPEVAEISVSLIPETIERTTLGRVRQGDPVNLEVDTQTRAIVDTVERVLSEPEWRARLSL